MRRVGAAIACLVALNLFAVGGGLVGEPLSTGGPMHFDFDLPIGILCLACGVIVLEGVSDMPGWVFCLAALAVVIPAGRNFYIYPPIADGAYFLLRYGRGALDGWTPAEPSGPMAAFAVSGWAAARAFGTPVGPRSVRLAVLALGAVLCCLTYQLFMRELTGGAGWLQLGLVIVSLVLVIAGCGGWAGRYDAARIGLGLATATALLSLASWGLYVW